MQSCNSFAVRTSAVTPQAPDRHVNPPRDQQHQALDLDRSGLGPPPGSVHDPLGRGSECAQVIPIHAHGGPTHVAHPACIEACPAAHLGLPCRVSGRRSSRVGTISHGSAWQSQSTNGDHSSAARVFLPGGDVARCILSCPLCSAVGVGTSGAVYVGVNLEFRGAPLNNSVHAEQFLVVNCIHHGEEVSVSEGEDPALLRDCPSFWDINHPLFTHPLSMHQALDMLAVSAAPCGHCRQFYAELVQAVRRQYSCGVGPALISDALTLSNPSSIK